MATTFTLAGEPFEMVTPSALTFAEARDYEKVTGFVFRDLLGGVSPAAGSAATTQALMWLSMKRVKPEQKFTDLDALSLNDIEVSNSDDEEPAEEDADPTPGEDSEPTD